MTSRTPPSSPGRRWAAVLGAVVVGAVTSLASGDLLNSGGWGLVGRFWRSALVPDLSAPVLVETGRAALTTVAYAAVGTALAMVFGVVLGVLTSETWWGGSQGRPWSPGRRSGWVLSRVAVGLPRGVHEAVWALLLVTVLGRDPVVAVLAIAVPFGAVTAKVFGEMVDECPRGPLEAVRATGAGGTTALLYAVLPQTLPALASYGLYRFECAVRSAVVLGMVGVGGLGFQLSQAFHGLAYRELWTSLYAVLVLVVLSDRWAARFRKGVSRRGARTSLVVAAAGVAVSVLHLAPDLGRLVSAETGVLAVELLGDLTDPALPPDGWPGLLRRAAETMQMSVVAMALAVPLALAVAVLAVVPDGGRPSRLARAAARTWLLLTRAVPSPVWALLALFVLLPGPLPGAVALGTYTAAVLGRLFAEALETQDEGPVESLRALGAGPATAVAYAGVPGVSGQLLSLGLYRWEVATRDTVVLGIVGAGGLGRLLQEQRAAFDIGGMAATVLALVALSLAVDAVSATVRRSVR